jgi:hypothetical protein
MGPGNDIVGNLSQVCNEEEPDDEIFGEDYVVNDMSLSLFCRKLVNPFPKE